MIDIIDKDIRPDTPSGYDARVRDVPRIESSSRNTTPKASVRGRTPTSARTRPSPPWDRRLHVVETRGTTPYHQLDLLEKVGG